MCVCVCVSESVVCVIRDVEVGIGGGVDRRVYVAYGSLVYVGRSAAVTHRSLLVQVLRRCQMPDARCPYGCVRTPRLIVDVDCMQQRAVTLRLAGSIRRLLTLPHTL